MGRDTAFVWWVASVPRANASLYGNVWVLPASLRHRNDGFLSRLRYKCCFWEVDSRDLFLAFNMDYIRIRQPNVRSKSSVGFERAARSDAGFLLAFKSHDA